jgi:diguanylate cyclase
VLAVSALVAVATLGLLLYHGPDFGMPLQDPWTRWLSAMWFAVVLAKIAAINHIGNLIRSALSASNVQLADALAQVRELSERDELTGLQNRRSILAQLTDERARFARGAPAFGLAILDIDHFKQVNDQFGHAMGDEVLRVFARLLTGKLRSSDRLARYGGEEFLLLLPGIGEVGAAVHSAERLRAVVDGHDWKTVLATLKVTCSIGVTLSRSGEGIAEMLERADAALYAAKSEGRNKVCVN